MYANDDFNAVYDDGNKTLSMTSKANVSSSYANGIMDLNFN